MEVFGSRRELPNATVILVLGILSLVFAWCYGIVGLILGIVAVIMAGSARRLYLAAPEEYTEASYKNVNAGRICGIIGICLSCLILIFYILVIFGIAMVGIGSLSSLGL